MKLSYKGANILDQLCHTIHQQDFPPLKSGISCGKCGHELKTYYCEERLYMVEFDTPTDKSGGFRHPVYGEGE